MISRVKAEDLLVDDVLMVGRGNQRVVKVERTDDKIKVQTASGQSHVFGASQLVPIMPDDDAGTEYIKKGHHEDDDL